MATPSLLLRVFLFIDFFFKAIFNPSQLTVASSIYFRRRKRRRSCALLDQDTRLRLSITRIPFFSLEDIEKHLSLFVCRNITKRNRQRMEDKQRTDDVVLPLGLVLLLHIQVLLLHAGY